MPDPAPPLERTADKKVSFRLKETSGKHTSVVANTHGLPAGISCPGRTSVCAGPTATLATSELETIAKAGEAAAGGVRGRETTWRHLLPQAGYDPTFPCYVVSELRRGTEENAAYRNWRTLKPHLGDPATLTAHLAATFDEFLTEAAAHDVEPFYRLHWDGDIATPAMAHAIAAALTDRPALHAWVYTRSLFAIPILAPVPNLVTYLSVDAGNVLAAAPVLAAHPGVRVAVLAPVAAAAADVLALLGRRPAPVCPVDTGKLPVVTAATAARVPAPGEDAVGACALCRLCVHGRSDVRFTLAKTLHVPKKVTAPVRFTHEDGLAHHFGRHPVVAGLFTGLVESLTDAGLRVGFTWRRTYVTLTVDGQVLARAQRRGTRLLVVYPRRPDRVRLHAGLRDITGMRHQCPGDLELTVTDPAGIPEAVRLAQQVHTGGLAAA